MSRMRITALSESRKSGTLAQTGSAECLISDLNVNYCLCFLVIDLTLEAEPKCLQQYFSDIPSDFVSLSLWGNSSCYDSHIISSGTKTHLLHLSLVPSQP